MQISKYAIIIRLSSNILATRVCNIRICSGNVKKGLLQNFKWAVASQGLAASFNGHGHCRETSDLVISNLFQVCL